MNRIYRLVAVITIVTFAQGCEIVVLAIVHDAKNRGGSGKCCAVPSSEKISSESIEYSESTVADLSGTYVSEITKSGSNQNSYFQKDEYRKLEIILKQTNNIITGTDSFGTATIKGTRTGDIINFTYWSPNARIAFNRSLYGKWKIKPGGSAWEGSWFGGGVAGQWNLTKIDADISGTYVSDITSNSKSFSRIAGGKLLFTLEQNDNHITAVNSTHDLKIGGTRKGNTIQFFVEPHQMNYHRDQNGVWEINPDGINITGSWKVKAWGVAGQWNLRRVE